MSTSSGSDTTTAANTNPSLSIFKSSEKGLSTGLIALIVGGSIFVLLLLIIGIYKYRNRDEGTYTIDEKKNYGPFAELDMPLNGSKSKKSKNKRKGLDNKEWYV